MPPFARHLFAYSLPFLMPEGDTPGGGGGGGGETPPTTTETDPPDPAVTLKSDAALQEFVNGLLAAERKKTEDRIKADAEKRDAELKEQREREEAEKRGEFETVKAGYESKVGELEAERSALTAELEQYRELVAKDVETAWSSIPEEVRETYTGADDDALAKKQHISRNAKIIERLTAAEERRPGNPPNPRPRRGSEPAEVESPLSKRQILT